MPLVMEHPGNSALPTMDEEKLESLAPNGCLFGDQDKALVHPFVSKRRQAI